MCLRDAERKCIFLKKNAQNTDSQKINARSLLAGSRLTDHCVFSLRENALKMTNGIRVENKENQRGLILKS